jgi:PTH1 family peptidyl-tRNA hydrolase
VFGIRRKSQSNRRPDLMIVGLGNPGPEYDGTRHNVGFQVVDEIAKANKIKLATFKVHARYTTWEHNDRAVLLVKPMTFMNRSGQAVGALARQYGLDPERIIVVADDLDLPVGTLKMKPKGGSGGHNGHKSIAAALGSDAYPRIKIGIGKSGETVDHVLSKFSANEKPVVERCVEKAVRTCVLFVTDGLEDAMQFCNSD